MIKNENTSVQPNSCEEAITMLTRILTELEARELSFNCIVDECIGVPWNDLCNKGIKLFEYLKADVQQQAPQKAQTTKELIASILKCDVQHHHGCLAPDCFTCMDSRCQMMLMELFPDEYVKRTRKDNHTNKTE